MSPRYTAILLATTLALPAMAQGTYQSRTNTATAQADTTSKRTTSKKTHKGKKHRTHQPRATRTSTSNGAIGQPLRDTTGYASSPSSRLYSDSISRANARASASANIRTDSANWRRSSQVTTSSMNAPTPPPTGQVIPSSAAPLKVKVDQSLAATARISADSAFAIARRHADNGEISSAELETSGGRLVYEVHVLNKSKRASTVTVDAMTGEVVEATQHGGLKSTLMHHKENKKLLDAKRDSTAKNP